MSLSQNPLIRVISWQNNQLTSEQEKANFYLERDNWNDFGFYTSYHLHASGDFFEDGNPKLIGHLRILKQGQESGQQFLLDTGAIEFLGSEYCSLPTSLDYYERLSLLPSVYRNKILEALRDIIILPEIRNDFKSEQGYLDSLMRDMTESDEIFELAPIMLERNYTHLAGLGLEFSFSIPEMEQPLKLDFTSPKYGWNSLSLPNRIAVIIGRNGSGKSTLLSRIARIAFTSPIDRKEGPVEKLGKIEPTGLGFTRIIALSYSAFDAFSTPGIYKGEKLAIIEEMKNGLGRYVFCGIRDVVRELEQTVPHLQTDEFGRLSEEDILRDRISNTHLKSNAEMGEEFIRNLEIIRNTNGQGILENVLITLSEEQSMQNLFTYDLIEAEPALNGAFFKDLSTGHKFVIHAITSLIAYSAPRSLILFDEPETHLHPPMLAVLMKAIRNILATRNAFMIAATHSPVVLQETLHKHVSVVRREGDSMALSSPEIQTFGENIGILTQLAFGLTTEVSDYHETLRSVVDQETQTFLFSDPDEVLEKIEKLFGVGLSIQARAYVISKLYQQN